jgi:site-specific recombinase XerD
MNREMWIPLFLEQQKALGFVRNSINRYRLCLEYFKDYLKQIENTDLRELTPTEAAGLNLWLSECPRKRITRSTNANQVTEKPLSDNFRYSVVSTVKKFFRFLLEEEKLISNPFEKTPYPKIRHKLPFEILTKQETESLLEAAYTLDGPEGLALVELIYSTGLRVSEVCNLDGKDLDLNENLVFVREGKGKKDRVVPLPQRSASILRSHLKIRDPSRPWLFRNKRGLRRLSVTGAEHRIKKAAEEAGITKRVTPHGLRHTYATHLLEGGMDIRYIQELLGHEYVTTTEIYTRVRDKEMIEVYKMCHPRA